MRVRLARSADAATIAIIYNQGIEDRVGTADAEEALYAGAERQDEVAGNREA